MKIKTILDKALFDELYLVFNPMHEVVSIITNKILKEYYNKIRLILIKHKYNKSITYTISTEKIRGMICDNNIIYVDSNFDSLFVPRDKHKIELCFRRNNRKKNKIEEDVIEIKDGMRNIITITNHTIEENNKTNNVKEELPEW